MIDVHVCKDTHGFDIELGTNCGENINYDEKYLDILRNNFSTLGKIVVDNKFCAIRNTTVSNFINKKVIYNVFKCKSQKDLEMIIY